MSVFCAPFRLLTSSGPLCSRALSACAIAGALLLVGGVRSVSAQAAYEAPAHIAVTDGTVLIEREADTIEAASGEPLVPGDRVRADGGRANIWFDDGTAVALDTRSVLEFGDIGLLRLTAGRMLVSVARGSTISANDANRSTSQPPSYRVDTPLGSASFDEPGDYLVDLMQTPRGDYLAVSVLRGAAELEADGGTMRIRSGERAYARQREAPSYPERFNSARLDEFEQWALSVRDDRRGRTTSTQYLPPNLQVYGRTFDRDGSWEYESAYGYVWYPVVETGWRPYYNGYWRPLPHYGWAWVAGDRWGWPTHHYGRWGYSRSRWFWIPERSWGPAWVSWASAADYVSWCPLGFDNRPVFGFSLAVGNTWAGWTLMPRQSFGGRNNWVARKAVDGRRLPRNTAFAQHAQAPVPPPLFRGRDGGGIRDGRDVRAGSDRVDRGGLRAGDRNDGGDGRRNQPSSASAVPRAGDRAVLPPAAGSRRSGADGGSDNDRRGGRGDGRPGNLPNDAPIMHGPGGPGYPGGGRSTAPYRNGDDDRAVRRGPGDDRPTPQAPRNGIYVDPGLPRSSDRMSPRDREVMPQPSPDDGRVRRRNGDVDNDRNNDGRGNSGPSGPPPATATPTTPPTPPPAAPSQSSSSGVRVRRWGQDERPSPPPTRRESNDSAAPPPSAGRAVPRDGGVSRGESAPQQDGGTPRGDSTPRQDGGGARRRGR